MRNRSLVCGPQAIPGLCSASSLAQEIHSFIQSRYFLDTTEETDQLAAGSDERSDVLTLSQAQSWKKTPGERWGRRGRVRAGLSHPQPDWDSVSPRGRRRKEVCPHLPVPKAPSSHY